MHKPDTTRDVLVARLPQVVQMVVDAAQDKKAADIVVLDLRKVGAFTDYFVICSGQNARQVKAVADAIEQALGNARIKPAHVEGYDRGDWVLVDCFDFIVHIFGPQTRRFYALERLWGSAERVEIPVARLSRVMAGRAH